MDQQATTILDETEGAAAVAEAFVAGLNAESSDALAAVLTEDVGLREHGPEYHRAVRGRDKVMAHLRREREAAPDLRFELLSAVGNGERLALEMRAQYTVDDHYLEDHRAAFLQLRDGLAHTVDHYVTAPMYSGQRGAWIAPADLSEAQLGRLFEEFEHSWDIREFIAPNQASMWSLRWGWGGSGDAHPGSNGVGGFRWPAEVADEKIEAMIDRFRQRGIGFTWYVSPFDEPKDLAERLERHGLLLAGDHVTMARVGLDASDIETHPDVEVRLVEANDDAGIEALLQIDGTCFHWTKEQIDERRASYFERARNPRLREKGIPYLAWLNGQAVGNGHLYFQAGLALLGGAGVLPAARGQKVYSTLLARRLADAHARGYHIAVIHAAPMSRPIVARYGFKPYARTLIYGWMPEPDPAVIRSLVPQE